MKHTPGPWRVINRERTSKPDRFGRTTETRETFINGANGLGSIAKLYTGHDQDASLIAAAPELLEACQLFMTAFNGTDPDKIQDSDPDSAAAIRAAITAIAKAKGEA